MLSRCGCLVTILELPANRRATFCFAVHHSGSESMTFRSVPARLFAFGLAISLGAAGREAFAIKQFSDQFKELYVKEGTPLAVAV